MKKIKLKTKKIIIPIAIIFLIIDLVWYFTYVGHRTNFVPIAVLTYAIYRLEDKKDKTSKNLSLVLIVASLLLMGYTLSKDNFLTVKFEDRTVQILVPFKTKIIEEDNNEYLLKINNIKSSKINDYLGTLKQQSCNSAFYYDEDQNISLGGYNSFQEDKTLLVVYDGNYCEEKVNGIKTRTYKNYISIEEQDINYSIEKFIEDGYLVYQNGKTSNSDTYKNFIEKTKNNEEAFIRIIYIENDEFFISDITFRQNSYIVEFTNRRSTFIGDKQTTLKTYDSLIEENGYLVATSTSGTQKISKIINY